jgi:hypothetical protein
LPSGTGILGLSQWALKFLLGELDLLLGLFMSSVFLLHCFSSLVFYFVGVPFFISDVSWENTNPRTLCGV